MSSIREASMKISGMVLAASTLLGGCSEQNVVESQKSSFTLTTGVQLLSVTECDQKPAQDGVDIKKVASREYIVGFASHASCGGDLDKAYLTTSKERKSTLVIGSEAKDGCECTKSIALKISDRLEPGEVLYVLIDGEVVGHTLVP
ncbi:hypothetical protein [Chitinolyticbacter meiyuanensis]|uniref:hypothetical protein n=1 Tax=Chitinolyticbacter meiyuanensis TaxID=682798 RepID=UPI0011E5C7B9|nr:hypothetical protein [Chitinolyticbacter meiyuanensis]